jgi:tetratricopeptide (TPR) repeat protein
MKKLLLLSAQILMLAVLSPGLAKALENALIPTAASGWLEQKTIKDQAEYNDYISALNMTDSAEKAAAMETFAGKYPASVVRVEALEQAMAAYQDAKNRQKVEQIASHLLEIDPGNIRALAVATSFARSEASSGNAVKLKETCANSQKGLQTLPSWPRPEGASESEFVTVRDQMAQVFYGAAGFCALQDKDYAAAIASYLKAMKLDPNDLQNAFQLSIAELEQNPLDPLGFWYCGKAINTALGEKNDAGVQSVTGYCKAKYHNYHGSNEGWDKMVAASQGDVAPPAGFAATIKKKPTPAELACQAVAENNPAEFSFSDMEFILQLRDAAPCNLEAANKVWAAIQDKEKQGQARLQIPVMVISATKEAVEVAVTEDNQQAKKADLKVSLEKPLLKLPASGTMINVIGVITKYELDPFFFIMAQAKTAVYTSNLPLR